MKIRTNQQLQEVLDKEFAWRIKEIHTIRMEARRGEFNVQRALVRAGVAVLYAHWEGFIKVAADSYVNYLSFRGIPYRHLKPCLIALGLKKSLADLLNTDGHSASSAAIDFMLSELDKPAKFPVRHAVDTESNLSSMVFKNISGWIGVDSSRYEAHFNFVDLSLLKRRNQIAHGEHLDVDIKDFNELTETVIMLLRSFKNDLENAAVGNTHLRNAQVTCSPFSVPREGE